MARFPRPLVMLTPLFVAVALLPTPAAADPESCGTNCSTDTCVAALVTPLTPITCSPDSVFCADPLGLGATGCEVFQICHVQGTGLVGCATRDTGADAGAVVSCIFVNACSAIHAFLVPLGAGPIDTVCSTTDLGGVNANGSPIAALPTTTAAQNVEVICVVNAQLQF